ncbi:MAG TPA: stage II sporulation protein M [Gemmatimonadaceae bacterium]
MSSDVPATRIVRSLDHLVEVETPEQIAFSYTIAGVGSRAAAAILDALISLAIVLALSVVGGAIRGAMPRGALGIEGSASGSWAMALILLLQFAVMWGYHVLFEAFADGQTPGKRQLGLRVVRDGGYSVGLGESAVRNLFRIIDMQPLFLYGVGIISAVVSKRGKRLGDIVAGTIVVRERALHLAPALAPSDAAARAGARAAATADQPLAPAPISALLTDDEYAVLERFVARRSALEPDRRRAFAAQLAARLASRLAEAGAAEASAGAPPGSTEQAALLRLFERERDVRARGGAARSDTGAAREQHAIVAEGAPRWRAFEQLLIAVRRRGLRKLNEEEVGDFVARYRELTTDFARLSTASRRRDPDALLYLGRLVAGGHNLLYHRRDLPLAQVWRYVAETIPREVRRSWRPILAAAAMLWLPALTAYAVVVLRPETAAEFIPMGMLDRAEQGVEWAKQGRGYIPDPEVWRPVMASTIIANNVQVTFAAFAFGVAAGLGTLFLLVTNGIFLGGIAGLYASKGIGTLLLAFVAPHGVLELTAIAIAGGAGLLLGKAIWIPGARPRVRALVEEGRRAITLIACSTIFLVFAGVIEGLVSPRETWPLSWKLAVAGGTGVVMVAYLLVGVRRG